MRGEVVGLEEEMRYSSTRRAGDVVARVVEAKDALSGTVHALSRQVLRVGGRHQ